MSTLLCASIISRDLTPEQRRKEKERVKNGTPDGSSNIKGGKEARTATMMSALDAAEEDLKSEAVPLRARGVVTLTRYVYHTSYIVVTCSGSWWVRCHLPPPKLLRKIRFFVQPGWLCYSPRHV